MICPNCGHENQDDAQECANCGESLQGSIPSEPPSIPERLPQWWQSLWFVITLTTIGFLSCCCPLFYIVAALLFWTNPVASRSDKIFFTIILALMAILGIVADSVLVVIFKRIYEQTLKSLPPGALDQL